MEGPAGGYVGDGFEEQAIQIVAGLVCCGCVLIHQPADLGAGGNIEGQFAWQQTGTE